MKVWPDDLIEYDHKYKMELAFPELSWLGGFSVRYQIDALCQTYNIRASWELPIGSDVWFLSYHLTATGREITHGEMFTNCIKPAYDGAMWIDCIDLGEVKAAWDPTELYPGLIPEEWVKALKDLADTIKTNWKLIAGIILAIILSLVALKVLPYGGKRKTTKRK